MELNIDEIKKYLPHRDPFLFVDKVTDINIGNDIDGEITFNAVSYTHLTLPTKRIV